MSKVTIDFTKTPVEISSHILGKQGEHNATELIITPPTKMSENEKIKSYSVVFQIGAGKKAYSPIVDKDETITVSLERDVTQVNCLSIQLEAYDGKENLLVKSERIDNLILEPSVFGDEQEVHRNSGVMEQVAANTAFRKQYTKERPTATIELSAEEGFFAIDAFSIPQGSFVIADAYGMHDENTLPIGTEIAKIEVRGQDDDPETGWIDINEMYKRDSSFMHIIVPKKVTIVNDYKFFAAAIYQYCGNSFIADELQDYKFPVARITYYTD